MYRGKRFKGHVRCLHVEEVWFITCSVQLCGVSILRAGEVLELALLSVCKDVMVGKMLIQTNPKSGEPEVQGGWGGGGGGGVRGTRGTRERQ